MEEKSPAESSMKGTEGGSQVKAAAAILGSPQAWQEFDLWFVRYASDHTDNLYVLGKCSSTEMYP